ncbi:MAG: hypothetical protein ABSH48_08980 [Verrucomicrobiota bacterium]|jgi:hypothetical protein
MNVAGITLAAAAVLWSTTAWSQDPGTAADSPDPAAAPAPNPAADTPYAGIVARNMFGLVPIPPLDPHAGDPPADPPPKITPTGIMTIFGRDQALFTAAPKAKPGQPAKDDAYVLAEGERQDDIEVIKINHETSIITFNNHGTVQELPLIAPKDVGGSAPGPGGGKGNPAFAGSRQNPAAAGLSRLPGGTSPGAYNGGYGRNNGNNQGAQGSSGLASSGLASSGLASGSPGYRTFGSAAIQSPDEGSQMTVDQQELLIETQRKVLQDQGDPVGVVPILPLTFGPSKQLVQQAAGDQ